MYGIPETLLAWIVCAAAGLCATAEAVSDAPELSVGGELIACMGVK